MKPFFTKHSRALALGAACLGLSFSAAADGHLAKAVANPDRPADEVARDAGRKPAEVLAFFGVEPSMTIYEHAASGGYYTAVLSDAVGADGTVHAQISQRFWDRIGDKAGPRHKALGNVKTHIGQITDFKGYDGTVDMVFVSLIFHHLHYNETTGDSVPDASKSFYAAAMKMLKPGGIFAIIEHQAPDGTPRADSAGWHRAALENAVTDLTGAGYEYVGHSDALANPDDPQNVPFRALTTGRDTSQRFVAKFRKPS